MQIHELNNYTGELDGNAYFAVDDGNDTGKISAEGLLHDVGNEIDNLGTSLNARIDNIIAGGAAPSVSEITDARHGADPLGAIDYASLGAAIRGQAEILSSEINNLPFAIYDAANVKDDYYLNSSGVEVSQVGWSISEYLRINKIADYYIKSATTSAVVWCWFYDESMGLLSSFKTSTAGQNELTAPANAKFVRFSIPTAEKSDFKYTSQILLSDADGGIKPNLIERTNLKKTFEDDVYIGYYYGTTGVVNAGGNWAITPLYEVAPGDILYMNNPFSQYLTCFDADKNFYSAVNAPVNNVPVTFEIPNGVAFIGINLLKANLGTYVITINGNPLGAKYDIEWLFNTNHVWENKSYISHGDSITWQDGEEYIQGDQIGEIAKGYQTVFAENVGLGRKFNFGKSGWSMAVVNGNGIVNAIIQIVNYSQFDLCTIAVGTNDFKLNVPLGNLGIIGDSTFDDTTFYGAFRKAVEYILTQSPTIRLVLMTPLQRDNAGYDVNYTNSAGHKLIDYVNAVKNVGEMYGLPVCDMYSNSGFTKLTLSTYTMDGLHPNDVGYKRMGDYLTGFLNAIGN